MTLSRVDGEYRSSLFVTIKARYLLISKIGVFLKKKKLIYNHIMEYKKYIDFRFCISK